MSALFTKFLVRLAGVHTCVLGNMYTDVYYVCTIVIQELVPLMCINPKGYE